MKIRTSLGCFVIVLILLFIGSFSTPSYALFVTDQLTINFTPSDPIFTSLTGGQAQISQLVQVGGDFVVNVIDQITVPTLNAGTPSFNTTTHPPDPCQPVDPMFFSFQGTANTALAGFIAQAWPLGAQPSDPITPAPAIDLGDFASSLTPLHMEGPIFAFVSTAPTGPISPLVDNTTGIPVGTWEVTVTPVPEPSTLVLLGVGLAGVGVVRRRLKG